MAEETIFTNEDFTGGSFEEGATLSLGTRFHVTDSGNAKRARFYCPPSGPGGSGTVLMRLYQVTGGPTLLATATFASPTVGAWNETDWIVSGSPALVPLVINTVYSTSYVTPNRYVASTAYTWPKISNGLHIESESPGGYFSSGDAMPAGTFGGNNYYADCVVEFGSGTTPVTSTLDARWQVRNLVAGTLDARWSASNTVSSTLDLRWQVRNIVQQTLNAQWAVRNAVTSTLDARWAVRVSVTSTLDARWQVRAQAIGTLDARWSVLQSATSTLDARWQVRNAVTSTTDLRWSTRAEVSSPLDLRWVVEPTSGFTSSVSDDFNDGVIDTGLWAGNYGSGLSETGGRARLPCDTDYRAFQTATIYEFDSVAVQVYPPALNGGTSNVSAGISIHSAAQPGGTDVAMFVDVVNGQVNCAARSGYFDGGAVQFAYDSTAHRWWRIRLSGTDLLWETSPNGGVWTTQRTSAAPAYLLTATDVSFAMETHRDDGSANFAEFDNFNLVPPLTQVTSTLDAQWAVKALVASTLDARWAVRNQITAALDVRWQTRQRATGTVDLRWIVDGEVFVPKSDVRAYLSQRVRARPTIAQIRAYL